MRGGIKFPNQDLAAKHKAAKAAPESFEPVFAYAQGVTDFCLASLVDKSCDSCADGPPRYKRRSELNPHVWPVIEDALPRLDALMEVKGLESEQMQQLVAVKGRLLWMVGRSTEEQSLIDSYALAHPGAVAVVRRRLELLREAGDLTGMESQCARSRAKMKTAPEPARLELLTTCVASHPGNPGGRTDTLDYAEYLPNLASEEDQLYRTHLMQLCEARVGGSEAECAQGCDCSEQAAEKPTAKCKRTCRDCRGASVKKLAMCKKLGEAPAPPPSPVARTKKAPARAVRAKIAPPPVAAPAPWDKVAPARKPKPVDDGSGAKQVEL